MPKLHTKEAQGFSADGKCLVATACGNTIALMTLNRNTGELELRQTWVDLDRIPADAITQHEKRTGNTTDQHGHPLHSPPPTDRVGAGAGSKSAAGRAKASPAAERYAAECIYSLAFVYDPAGSGKIHLVYGGLSGHPTAIDITHERVPTHVRCAPAVATLHAALRQVTEQDQAVFKKFAAPTSMSLESSSPPGSLLNSGIGVGDGATIRGEELEPAGASVPVLAAAGATASAAVSLSRSAPSQGRVQSQGAPFTGHFKVSVEATHALRPLYVRHASLGGYISHITNVPRVPGLALCCSDSEVITLINVVTQTVVARFMNGRRVGHTYAVIHASVHPSCNAFISSGQDNTVKIWALDTPLVKAAVEMSFWMTRDGRLDPAALDELLLSFEVWVPPPASDPMYAVYGKHKPVVSPPQNRAALTAMGYNAKCNLLRDRINDASRLSVSQVWRTDALYVSRGHFNPTEGFKPVQQTAPIFSTIQTHSDYVDFCHWAGNIIISRRAGLGLDHKMVAWIPDPDRPAYCGELEGPVRTLLEYWYPSDKGDENFIKGDVGRIEGQSLLAIGSRKGVHLYPAFGPATAARQANDTSSSSSSALCARSRARRVGDSEVEVVVTPTTVTTGNVCGATALPSCMSHGMHAVANIGVSLVEVRVTCRRVDKEKGTANASLARSAVRAAQEIMAEVEGRVEMDDAVVDEGSPLGQSRPGAGDVLSGHKRDRQSMEGSAFGAGHGQGGGGTPPTRSMRRGSALGRGGSSGGTGQARSGQARQGKAGGDAQATDGYIRDSDGTLLVRPVARLHPPKHVDCIRYTCFAPGGDFVAAVARHNDESGPRCMVMVWARPGLVLSPPISGRGAGIESEAGTAAGVGAKGSAGKKARAQQKGRAKAVSSSSSTQAESGKSGPAETSEDVDLENSANAARVTEKEL